MIRYALASGSESLQQIVNFLAPYAQKVAEYPGSWLVPVFLLILVSFPPLFGHELIAVYVPFNAFVLRLDLWGLYGVFLLRFCWCALVPLLAKVSFSCHFDTSSIIVFNNSEKNMKRIMEQW